MIDPLMIAVGLIGDRPLTDEVLAEVMFTLAALPATKNHDLERIRKQLEATIGIRVSPGEGLSSGENEPWIEDIKAEDIWHYWEAYKKQLRAENLGALVPSLDEDTDRILNECGFPRRLEPWRIQGLVMGDVQSGKTASYSGLICKAADAGYKIIVLLTGTIEDLRAQTQERLDEGFVGRNSKDALSGATGSVRIGAGRFRDRTANVLTSTESDFLTSNNSALQGIPLENIKEPVLLVMKKNKTALQNLNAFLRSQRPKGSAKLSAPLFLVDDEADNASVNANKDESPATINKLIREVLDQFHQSSYVAYTATPFANIFINPDLSDLFPSNFVYALNAASNYIGADSLFSETGDYAYQVEDILDAADVFPDKHKKDLQVDEIPSSLQDAVGVFLLSCAIRDLRREELRHRSMLVNVTRFTDVQIRLADVLRRYVHALVEDIKAYLAADELWSRHASLARLHELFLKHYHSNSVSWEEVREALYDSVASVKVLTINQKADRSERLNYGAYKASEKGRRVIAVGGLTLSRGLTLYGLCVSYFYRNSKAYDTLLQMGRWFGYRPGYDDLCRIWMTPDAQDWFAHIGEVVRELRADLRRMHQNRLPPRQFGIRVRSHPDSLLVTAANKMRNSTEVEIQLSFSGKSVESPYLPNTSTRNDGNARIASSFIETLRAPAREGRRYVWRKVKAADVAQFLGQLDIPAMNAQFIPDQQTGERPLVEFIRENTIEKLSEWDVCVPEGDGDKAIDFSILDADGAAQPVQKRLRQFEKATGGTSGYVIVNKHRVGEIADEKVLLDKNTIREAEDDWRSESAENAAKTVVPGDAYRRKRQRPLLTIHAIQPSGPSASKDPGKPPRTLPAEAIKSKLLIAVSLSFPEFEESEQARVLYRLNKVYLQNLGLLESDGDEDED